MKKFSLLVLISCVFLCCQKGKESAVVSGAVFTEGIEGPAVNHSGILFAVNFQEEGTIGCRKSDQDSFKICVKLPEGSIGNGIRFLNDSVCYVADYKMHQVLEVNVWNKNISVHAHDNRMNQPNDIAITDDGDLYASDPNWKEGTGNIWKVTQEGKVFLMEANMGTTNGIEVSPDGKYLYVNESVQRNVWRYDIKTNSLENKTLFHQFKAGGMDGMRCDQKGNLYIARYEMGEVAILDSEGNLLEVVQLHGSKPTNVAFGGKDGKTVYVTMQDKKWVESFRSDYPGRSFQQFSAN